MNFTVSETGDRRTIFQGANHIRHIPPTPFSLRFSTSSYLPIFAFTRGPRTMTPLTKCSLQPCTCSTSGILAYSYKKLEYPCYTRFMLHAFIFRPIIRGFASEQHWDQPQPPEPIINPRSVLDMCPQFHIWDHLLRLDGNAPEGLESIASLARIATVCSISCHIKTNAASSFSELPCGIQSNTIIANGGNTMQFGSKVTLVNLAYYTSSLIGMCQN